MAWITFADAALRSVLLGVGVDQEDPDAKEELDPLDITEICFADNGSLLAVGFEGGLVQVRFHRHQHAIRWPYLRLYSSGISRVCQIMSTSRATRNGFRLSFSPIHNWCPHRWTIQFARGMPRTTQLPT